MGIDVHPAVLIRRPRADVAALMFDPRHEARWTKGVVSSRPLHPGGPRGTARPLEEA
ncbi:hypothetical protein [Vulgatibacter sp.]|uniref:hypothetical protein n=1 Tax=Vulgatibacter sp. TaxID=1971226 RepID=UPI003567D222